jgi:hypothetical protein
MNRAARLDSAKATNWISSYSGKNIVRGYYRWFGVDALCAAAELRALGVPISAGRKQELLNAAERRTQAHAERKRRREMDQKDAMHDSDDTYQYVTGYSLGGIPDGVTWEEAGEAPEPMREPGEEPDWLSDVEEGPVADVRLVPHGMDDSGDVVPF